MGRKRAGIQLFNEGEHALHQMGTQCSGCAQGLAKSLMFPGYAEMNWLEMKS